MALPSITWNDVLAIAPQLSSVGAADRVVILAQVDAEIGNPKLSAIAVHAKALLAAALATQRTKFSTESTGPAIDDTSYGRELRRLLENTPDLRLLAGGAWAGGS
jgi:hypothetical protein